MDVRDEIRDFLTLRRAKVTPEQAGLPGYGPRRVPGLRREEVAVLAGISARYYTHLERGHVSGVSESVLNALARALQLDDSERAHLHDLVRAAQPVLSRPRPRPPRQAIRPAVQQLLDAMTHTAAFVCNEHLDVLGGNSLACALHSPMFANAAQPLNAARFVFLDSCSRDFYVDWDQAARSAVAIAPRRRRPSPLRPGPFRPCRRAVDTKRSVPHVLGVARCPLQHQRHQATPSSDRRRPGTEFRGHEPRRRPRLDDLYPHRRARITLRTRVQSPRQPDGHRRAAPRGGVTIGRERTSPELESTTALRQSDYARHWFKVPSRRRITADWGRQYMTRSESRPYEPRVGFLQYPAGDQRRRNRACRCRVPADDAGSRSGVRDAYTDNEGWCVPEHESMRRNYAYVWALHVRPRLDGYRLRDLTTRAGRDVPRGASRQGRRGRANDLEGVDDV